MMCVTRLVDELTIRRVLLIEASAYRPPIGPILPDNYIPNHNPGQTLTLTVALALPCSCCSWGVLLTLTELDRGLAISLSRPKVA